jgi:hypothetical protein
MSAVEAAAKKVEFAKYTDSGVAFMPIDQNILL